jgi:23S rRNA U2552 (ribose-2'-O)-methylase RlmE/FtsJ
LLLLDPNQASFWETLYSCEINGEIHHFDRAAKQSIMGNDGEKLRQALVIQSRQNVVLIGAAFGWIAEDWVKLGINVVAVDTSTWIHANLEGNAVVPIINADCRTEPGREAILNALNTVPDFVISEDVLPVLTDDDCNTLALGMRALGGKTAHWITTGTSGDVDLNWKTQEQWKQMFAGDLIIQRGTSVVI